MLFCQACGHQPPEGSRFCNMCGQALQSQAAESKDYTPPHLVEKVLRMRSALEGERKLVTVLFADVKGSVALSELIDAEAWHNVMDRFFAIVTTGIHDFEGTINQYTGDGIMALFGAPIAHEDHARRACLAALRIQKELRTWADDLQQEYGIEFLVRIGMNSGEVVVGRIGDDLRMDYTAQGHTVGLAARMESLAKPGRIYLSEFTHALIHSQFELREKADVRVKGVSGRVRAYELRRMEKYRSRFEVARERGLPPLIGREAELEILSEALTSARNGKGSMVALTGDPGIGKSRLLHEFAEHCQSEEIKVIQTRGVPYHKAVPAAPLANFLKSYFRIDDDDAPDEVEAKVQKSLKRLSPQLMRQGQQILEFLGYANEPSRGDAAFEKRLHSLGSALIALIDAAAEDEPGVVLVDNLHWVDNEMVAPIMDYVVSRLPSSRTLVVVSYRPEYENRWLAEPHVRELRLSNFDKARGEVYLNALLGEDDSLDILKTEIFERTAGNPLFMEQVARMLIDNGQLEKARSGGYRLKQALDKLEVPAEIQALISARVDRLADNDKRLLQVASVIGNQFDVQLLQSVSGLGSADVSEGLDRLTVGGWFYRRSLAEGGGRVHFAFHQSLLRDVAYNSQLAENRATIHRAVASYLTDDQSRQPEGYEALVAHHYAYAGDIELAVHWHARAANWSASRDISLAMRHWRAVSDLVDQLPDSTHSTDVALQACSRLIYLGSRHGMSPEELAALVERGQKLYDAIQDDSLRSFFLIARGTAAMFAADARQAMLCFEQAAALESVQSVVGVQAALCMGRGHMLMILGDLWQAESVIADGLTLLDGDADSGAEFLGRSPYVSLLSIKSWLRYYQGRLKEATRLLDAARQLSEARAEPEHLVLCDIVDSLMQGELGKPRKALEAAQSALQKAERQRHGVLEVTALWVLGLAYVVSDKPKAALEVLERGQTLVVERQVALHVEQRLQLAMARAHILAGDTEAAKSILRDTIKLARKRGQRLIVAEAALCQAELLLGEGINRRLETEVLAHLKQTVEIMDEIGAEFLRPRWHLASSLLASQRGDESRATNELQSALGLLKDFGAASQLKRLQKSLGKKAKS